MTVLPTPDFTWDPVKNPPKAGLRPKRKDSYRLEPEPHNGRLIVHNYGHAGAGITMSWGCAYEIASIIASHGIAAGENIAVLGGGVMGLTAAVVLTEQNFKVTMYAAAYPPDTTSNVAGGQWAPASVLHTDKVQFARILQKAFDTHKAKGTAYGVSPRDNYATSTLPSFADVPSATVPPPTKLAHLPFAHLNSPGYVYKTLLVEPPIFLPKLMSDLDQYQVPRKTKTFGTMNEVFADPDVTQKVIVNCTGLGAGKLCGDPKVFPVKGQLAMLPPQPALQYLFCAPGYLFPRKDAVVVGGSEETTFTDDKPDLAMCRTILAHVKNAFVPSLVSRLTPNALAVRMRPDWLINSK